MRTLFMMVFVGVLTTANATEKKQDPLSQGTLQEQFDAMIERSNRYQDFKVVKRSWLDRFGQNINDTLQGFLSTELAQKQVVSALHKEISELKLQVEGAMGQVSNLQAEKDSMTFFGASMSKAGYKSTLWTLVGCLAFMLFFFMLKFKNSNVLTVNAKESLARTEEEFDRFRKFARDREQTISRELQNEMNKRAAS